jgi:hypothetical protein
MWWAVTSVATSICGATCAEESLPSFYAEACVFKGTDTDARMCRQLVKNDEGVQGDFAMPKSLELDYVGLVICMTIGDYMSK